MSVASFFRIAALATAPSLSSIIVLIRYYKCLKFGKDRVPKVLDCLQIHKTMVLNTLLSLHFFERHEDNVDCFYFLKAPV